MNDFTYGAVKNQDGGYAAVNDFVPEFLLRFSDTISRMRWGMKFI